MAKTTIITMDGPASSGKSTIARDLAKGLGFRVLNSGQIYRAYTLCCLRENCDLQNQDAVIALLNQSDIAIHCDGSDLHVFVGNEDVTTQLRSAVVTENVSQIAQLPDVRTMAIPLQRNQAIGKGLIAEGRDMGSVIFPEAHCKIYLKASLEKRAQRRMQDRLDNSATGKTLETVIRDLQRRDAIDSTRKVAPLQIADDAIVIDTSNLNLEEVLQTVQKEIDRVLNEKV